MQLSINNDYKTRMDKLNEDIQTNKRNIVVNKDIIRK